MGYDESRSHGCGSPHLCYAKERQNLSAYDMKPVRPAEDLVVVEEEDLYNEELTHCYCCNSNDDELQTQSTAIETIKPYYLDQFLATSYAAY
mmetsp:Transcript_3776/g.5787  ORF Transcript_3776/g.5787 Transcript_3776/m.5787 type:complete len:92 (-) Transcript_3776:286-561(-)